MGQRELGNCRCNVTHSRVSSMYLYRRSSSWSLALRYVIRKTGNEQNKMRHRSANECIVLTGEYLLAVKAVVKTVNLSSSQLLRNFS
jgi:hypothetical protein